MAAQYAAEPETTGTGAWQEQRGGRQEQSQQRVPPADEADREPDLAALLHKMRRLAAQRDSNGLEAIMLPTFKVEFDAGQGAAAFRRRWHSESNSSKLWGVLDRLFALGGTFYTDTLFALPYVYTKFPSDTDLLGHVVAVKSRRTSCGPARGECCTARDTGLHDRAPCSEAQATGYDYDGSLSGSEMA